MTLHRTVFLLISVFLVHTAAKGNEWVGTMILIKWAVICYNMVLEIQYAQES